MYFPKSQTIPLSGSSRLTLTTLATQISTINPRTKFKNCDKSDLCDGAVVQARHDALMTLSALDDNFNFR